MRKHLNRTPPGSFGGWRVYQDRLRRDAALGKVRGRLARWLAAAAVVALAASVYMGWHAAEAPDPAGMDRAAQHRQENRLTKADLQEAIPPEALLNLKASDLEIRIDSRRHLVETSLDLPLQRYLMDQLDRRHSRYIGIVALEPATGRVLAMVGYDRSGKKENPCVEKVFPAASVFKIVTAAAAIEDLGLLPDSQMTYNGRKHTLYKSQLRTEQNRYTNRTTLRRSFALSINPVFGKIGTHRLHQELLAKYADAFGFNEPIPFEVPVAASTIQITDDPYQWAEVASGFNQDTRISALHGAMIASVALNGGRMVAPTIVEKVTDPQGRVVYQGRPGAVREVISAGACRQLADLMEATVSSGTSRSAFRGLHRDWVLSKLTIGGKSGSINSRDNKARFDWFVGFARETSGEAKVAVSAVVAHEKYIGRRAAEYARLAIRRYFQETFASRKEQTRDAPG
ncbi:MAG: penicillin-binding transpeptidase domain-containing protein [Desulfobacterales bacterium]|jgi:cell division protein FtsI/penicillin-binding protein 2